ncbi:DUF1700 domain-containing protein [Clostridium swellfunianum]|uniref:HAAS signaling domain-containing protein n=1 Tax=Clostridium swellfunianum TaxID=1367462 RepID=UPI00202FC0EF|nr:DUF1700 domain-containing protein [Clostridium swellfunianum]MCM0649210.1 DUF1700 domain-containing protein [Clostridium swellfunianum]
MNKDEFLKSLDEALTGFTWQEKKDIIYDYEEHFRIGLQNGKSDEGLIEELGDPKSIASQYRENLNVDNTMQKGINHNTAKVSKLDNTSISGIAAISLLIFNLIFILAPFLGLASAIIGLFAGAIGAFFGGIALIFGTVFENFINDVSGLLVTVSPIASILFGVGTTAFGVLFFIGDCYIAKYFIKGTVKYINWNLRIIKKQGDI